MRPEKVRPRRSSQPCSQRLSLSRAGPRSRPGRLRCGSGGKVSGGLAGRKALWGPARPASRSKSPTSFRQIAGDSITGRFASPVRPVSVCFQSRPHSPIQGPPLYPVQLLLSAWTCRNLLNAADFLPAFCLRRPELHVFPSRFLDCPCRTLHMIKVEVEGVRAVARRLDCLVKRSVHEADTETGK